MSPAPILVLDVDGVVLPILTDNLWYETIQQDLGIDLSGMREEFFVPHYEKCLRGELDYESTLEEFLKAKDAQCSVGDFLAYSFSRDAQVDPDVLQAALRWKEKTNGQLALATNQVSPRATYIWQRLELNTHCDVMIASCHVGAVKPDASFYKAADEILSRAPDQGVTFLDDSVSHIEGARAHGWSAHHVCDSKEAVDIIASLN
jgi:HAD superfamily hydrolase (TIGR01509 family)